ncbi:hypothetical protein AB751O23_AA_00610 [Chlamydiales bacterium SCGC AB-751-O23]|jgi:hypothetical protein|nr:hypothetical protein AB751O23_AA_00610 [Chlamydiales bacterium SCGC AB-751-O23]
MDTETSNTYFPFLDTDERKITAAFCSSCDSPSSPTFDYDLKSMLNMIKRLYQAMEKMPLNSDLRSIFRAKLMNIAGIYTIIPPHKILAFIGKNFKKLKAQDFDYKQENLSSQVPENFFFHDLEKTTLDILQFPIFSTVFKLHKKDDERYLEDILAYCKYIIFKKDIKDETFSNYYLTSTSEPLSQSVLLNLKGPEGKTRDILSLSFDIIYQSTFLKIFYSNPNLYKPNKCENIARDTAEDFAKKAQLLLKNSPEFKEAIAYFNSLSEKNSSLELQT